MTVPEPPPEVGTGRWLVPAAFILPGTLWGSRYDAKVSLATRVSRR